MVTVQHKKQGLVFTSEDVGLVNTEGGVRLSLRKAIQR